MITHRLVPALLAALLISGLFTLWLSKRVVRQPVVLAAAGLQYVAAAKDLKVGEPLQAASLLTTDWPAAHPVPGAFLKPNDLQGRILLFPLAAGELVLDHNLASLGAGVGLTAKIPAGLRAISLRSDEISGVSGFLLPGSFVDVLVTYHTTTANDLVTATVLQNVRILAAGQKFEADPDGKASNSDVVTLLATPQEAEKLALASSAGKIHFVLRNGVDHTAIADLAPQSALPGIPVDKPAGHGPRSVARVARPYTVQTNAGGKLSEEHFEGSAK